MPSGKKFKQRYWLNLKHYVNGPILLVSGGNGLGTNSLSLIEDEGIIDQFASSLNGAAIVLEHRYFGESLPYDDLSEKNLERLTIQQSIDDLAYFAQNVKLPMNLSTLPNNTMDNRRSRLRSSCPDEVLMKSCVRRNGHD